MGRFHSQPGRGAALKGLTMYPMDSTLPATVPLGKFHARAWRVYGKVYLMLHHEARPQEAHNPANWAPFAVTAPWQLADARSAARNLTQCLYPEEAEPILEPLARLIMEVCGEPVPA